MQVTEYRSRRCAAKIPLRKIRLDDFYVSIRHGDSREGVEEEDEEFGSPGVINFSILGARRRVLVTVVHGPGVSGENKVKVMMTNRSGRRFNHGVTSQW